MKNKIILTILSVLIAVVSAHSQTYFQKIAGNWEGTLEYQDYSADKRVKLKTYLSVKPSSDGNSAEFVTVYDDFGKIIKETETIVIDRAAKKYRAGDFEYRIDSFEKGKIVLLGAGEDGEKIEPIRKTITFGKNSLDFLKETRTPWQFRNRLTLRKTKRNNAPQ